MRRCFLTTLAVLLLLPGCAAAEAPAPEAAPTPAITATAKPTPTATPTPSATPTNSETPAEPVVAGCDTVLTDDEYVALAEDGLTLDPEIYVLDDTMQAVMDQGFGCYWSRSGGDVRVWYAQAEQDADAWATQRQQLIDDGWTQTDSPIAGVLTAPADHDPNYVPAIVHVDGSTYYASYSDYFSSVTALVG
ncbi:hypothetical protein [Cryobacterium sp. AP23]